MPKLTNLARRLTFEHINNLPTGATNKNVGFLSYLLASKAHLQLGKRYIYGVGLQSFGHCIFLISDYFKHWNGDDSGFSNRIRMSVESILAVLKLIRPWNQKLDIDFYNNSIELAMEVASYLQGPIYFDSYREHEDATEFLKLIAPRVNKLCFPIQTIRDKETPIMNLELLKIHSHNIDLDRSEHIQNYRFRILDLSNLSSAQIQNYSPRLFEDNTVLDTLILRTDPQFNFISIAFYLQFFQRRFPNFGKLKLYLDAPNLKTLQHEEIADALVKISTKLISFQKRSLGFMIELDAHLNEEVAVADQIMAEELINNLKQKECFQNAKFAIAPFVNHKGIHIIDKRDEIKIDIKLKWKF